MATYYSTFDKLNVWLQQADFADISWFAPRKVLWEQFRRIVSVQAPGSRGIIAISRHHFNTIKSFLLTRPLNTTQEQTYAFQNAVQELLRQLGEDQVYYDPQAIEEHDKQVKEFGLEAKDRNKNRSGSKTALPPNQNPPLPVKTPLPPKKGDEEGQLD